MRTVSKFAASLFALALMVAFSGTAMAAEVTIKGTVTGQDGKPAASVPVRLMKAMAKKAETKSALGGTGAVTLADKGGAKAAPLAETTTDDMGKFTLKADVEPGEYTVMAGNRDAGMGRETVNIKAGEKPSDVSITLKASKKK